MAGPSFAVTPKLPASIIGVDPIVVTKNGLSYTISSRGGGTGSTVPVIVTVRSANSSPVTVSATTDYMIYLDTSSVAITVNLPASPTTGLTYIVKDGTGHAASNNVTVSPATGNIDGAASFVMSTNYQAATLTYTGAQWSVS